MKRVLIIVIGFIAFFSGSVGAQQYIKVMSLYGSWKFSIGDDMEWAGESYNDSNWENIKVPSAWEDQGFNGYDGFGWYRKKFIIAPEFKNSAIYLNLGYIDDADEVYVNGHLVGYTGSMPPKYSTAFNAFRRYYIPGEILYFDKQNTIAVRVYDAQMAGGIVNGDVSIVMQNNPFPFLINLQGIWKFSPRDNMEWKSPSYNDSNWKYITVPKPWEDQGYQYLDGFAWYRKKFFVSHDYSNERLVLVLGKIDDFDEVYVNGEYVGPVVPIDDAKNGGTRYGQLRAYYISGKLLQPNKYNVISVRVLDTGGLGGIYEGPVGIARQSEYVQYWRGKR